MRPAIPPIDFSNILLPDTSHNSHLGDDNRTINRQG
jgi:hypothetical protein